MIEIEFLKCIVLLDSFLQSFWAIASDKDYGWVKLCVLGWFDFV